MPVVQGETTMSSIILALLVLCSPAHAFYLPGMAPRSYRAGDAVPVSVNVLTSSASALPYGYYDNSLGFCKPAEGVSDEPESLGSVLFGDRIANSPINIKMLQNASCTLMCESTVSPQQARFLNDRIRENYQINWCVSGTRLSDKPPGLWISSLPQLCGSAASETRFKRSLSASVLNSVSLGYEQTESSTQTLSMWAG